MRFFYWVTWLIFIYFLFLWNLVLDITVIFFIFWFILFFAILSEFLYKKYYKIQKKFYEFFLYPSVFILLILGWLFLDTGNTQIYEMKFWDKEITFIWMSHIGTQDYYETIAEIIEQTRNEESILVYEWITMSWPNQEENTNQTTKNLESIFQNNELLANKYFHIEQNYDHIFRKQGDINIDMNSQQINKIFEEFQKNSTTSLNSDEEIYWEEMHEMKQSKWLQKWKNNYMTKWDIFFLRSYYNIWLFIESLKPKDILSQILVYKRNEYLFSQLEKLDENNIIITYWNGHLKHFLSIVQEKYPDAKITLLQHLDPYK